MVLNGFSHEAQCLRQSAVVDVGHRFQEARPDALDEARRHQCLAVEAGLPRASAAGGGVQEFAAVVSSLRGFKVNKGFCQLEMPRVGDLARVPDVLAVFEEAPAPGGNCDHAAGRQDAGELFDPCGGCGFGELVLGDERAGEFDLLAALIGGGSLHDG